MKKILFSIFLVIVLFSPSYADQSDLYDQFIGEKITYRIKSLGVHAANADLSFEGTAKIDGQDVYLLTFHAKGANFLDIEKIYVNKQDFYPVRVERDLNILGSKEKITESYDQENFVVTIEKKVEDKEKAEEKVIKKTGKIDNIYCFIYRFRAEEEFEIGKSFEMNLPTKDVSIKIAKKTKVKALKKVYEAYYFQTVPRQYEVWFDVSSDKIPIRIDKPAIIGGTSMVMTEYKKQ